VLDKGTPRTRTEAVASRVKTKPAPSRVRERKAYERKDQFRKRKQSWEDEYEAGLGGVDVKRGATSKKRGSATGTQVSLLIKKGIKGKRIFGGFVAEGS